LGLSVGGVFLGVVFPVFPTAAYVHIPFCRRRCFYCDFPISVVGDRPPVGPEFGAIAQYIPYLCREIQHTARLESGDRAPLQSVFLGGGTPSLLKVSQLATILQALDQQFGIAADAEISMEIDPGTFDRAQLQGYRVAGINRVSLGVQAFQPQLLAACGRTHTVADIQQAIATIHQVGLENYSLDLISGLPHQTLADWRDSLHQAIALQPPHLSCYDLTIEPMTAFGRRFQPGDQPLPSDEATAQMYRMAQQTLTAAGYAHYEISNYAKPGYACRHNHVYWNNQPFYGFGMGATSYVGGDRYSRPRKTQEYYAWVAALESQASQPVMAAAKPTPDLDSELLLDTLMLGLRLAEGVNLQPLQQQFGSATIQRVWQCVQPYALQDWVRVVSDSGDRLDPQLPTLPELARLGLSDPEGFLFSNVVLVALFEEFGGGQRD
jgi:putative oxygen-independent coproporphyrinogen III oxidase